MNSVHTGVGIVELCARILVLIFDQYVRAHNFGSLEIAAAVEIRVTNEARHHRGANCCATYVAFCRRAIREVGARSHDANRAYDPAAQRGLLSCEHVLDAGANFASVVVRIRLRLRQRALASGYTALEAAGAQSLLDRARAIGAVAEHVRRRVALSLQLRTLLNPFLRTTS